MLDDDELLWAATPREPIDSFHAYKKMNVGVNDDRQQRLMTGNRGADCRDSLCGGAYKHRVLTTECPERVLCAMYVYEGLLGIYG